MLSILQLQAIAVWGALVFSQQNLCSSVRREFGASLFCAKNASACIDAAGFYRPLGLLLLCRQEAA